MRPRTDRQTDTQTRVTTIHFSWFTTHAKCNDDDANDEAQRRYSVLGIPFNGIL